MLHVDRNKYYGGSEAAVSLQEAESWVSEVNKGSCSEFKDASLWKATEEAPAAEADESKLAFSRAYSLSLSSPVIYTRSSLLKILISSKIYHQLEFLSVGSWWVYDALGASSALPEDNPSGTLKKVPNGREDVFADKSIDLKSKRLLMVFLRFVGDYENQTERWHASAESALPDFLTSEFGIPDTMQTPILAISMSPKAPTKTTVADALPNIARHLRSIGVFGPGFGAVTPRWGGAGEICQVACRAGAVGGGVYMLGTGVESITALSKDDESTLATEVNLRNGEKVKVRWVVGSSTDLPPPTTSISTNETRTYHLITIVASTLSALLPVTAEGAPPPAGAVVVFPTGSVSVDGLTASETPPIYTILHSSDTGECPQGQSKPPFFSSTLAN